MRALAATLFAATALLAACESATPPASSVPVASVPAAPSSMAVGLPPLADVPFYRADPVASGLNPGPGPLTRPELAWRAEVGGMHMVPILVDGVVIAGTEEGQLIALDAHTGAQRWAYQADGPIKPSLASAGGLVYASDGSAVHAVDVRTGSKRWSVPVEDEVGRINVVDGVLYVGTVGGVVGIDPRSGKETWRWGGPPDVPVGAGPVVDGVGYFAARDGRVYAIDTTTGRERWSRQTISLEVASGQVVGDTFYVSTNQGEAAEPVGEIYAIDRQSGEVRWRFRSPSGVQLKEGPVKDGVLFANGRQDGVYALRDDGDAPTVLWHVDAPESHWPMALVGDTLYQTRVDGSVGAYSTADGTLLWETEPEGDWTGGPIVSGGMVFVANDSTGVMAFAEPELIAMLPERLASSPTPSASGPVPAPPANPFTVVGAHPLDDLGIGVPLGMDPGPDGLLYVLDTEPQVTVVDPEDARVVRRWGHQGSGPGEFDVRRADDNPGNGDIAVAPDGRVYVADGSNHRVQVFDADGAFRFQFGSFGFEEGQFGAIQEIEVGPDGAVYVRDDRHLDRYSADGKFVWRSPDDVYHFAIRSDGVLVASCEPCRELILVDPGDGRITERWDEPEIDGDPLGVVNVDTSDNIFMQVYGNNAQLVFDPHGTFIGRMTQATIGTGGPPVFLPDGRGFMFTEDGLVELTVTVPAG